MKALLYTKGFLLGKWLCLFYLSGLLWAAAGQAPASDAINLSTIEAQKSQHRLPIILYFRLDDCPYCQRLSEHVLHPMLKGGQFRDNAHFVEISLEADSMLDFSGHPTLPKTFAEAYGFIVAPMLVFVDGQGKQLIDPVIGLPNLAYFGFEFRQMIRAAKAKLIQ